ncbi:putative ribonuclease H-like domain-containing protein [Tanacetum coccineum]
MDLQDQGVIDSGCSRHMTWNMSYITNYEEIDGGYVSFGGNPKGGKITRKGTIKTGNLDFENVYFVRELKFNLFSVSQMCDKKNNVLFNDTECIVLSPNFKLIDESQVLLRVPRKNNMYSVDLKNIVPKGGLTCLFAKATSDESKLWHRRLGHLNFKTMNKLVKGNLVRGLPSKLFENDQTCVACQKGKQHRASCKSKTKNLISLPLHLLHMDLFGPTFVKSLKKKMYCLVVIDDYSRFTWVFFLATKDETSGILKSFITGIENLVDHKVKVIRCDNGTEFKNREMNQTLIEAARTMLADSKLPTTFWAEAVNTACYVQNRVLVVKPHNKTPYELFHGRTPTLSFMRPFRCLVTILNTIDHLGKFDGKADEGFFVGYSLNSKAFRVFNSRTRIVEENLHIRFSKCTTNVVGSGLDWLFGIDALTRTMNYEPIVAGTQFSGFAGTKTSDNDRQARKETKPVKDYILLPKEDNVNSTNNVNAASTNEVNVVGGKTRIELLFDLNMPALEDDSIFDFSRDDEDDGEVADMNNLDTTIQVSPNPTIRIHKDYPLDQVIGDLQSATQTRKMSKNLEEHGFVKPKKVIHAFKDPSWIEAIQEEFLQFKIQEAWTLVDLPNGKRAIGSKWEEGIDYDEVFAHVARIEVIRLFLAYASFKDFIVYQMDVKSAFLYGKIKEEVYVSQPPGFENPDFPDRVYKVEKALHGLHQAPKAWYETLSTYLLDNVYVDDIIFGSTKKELCIALRCLMREKISDEFLWENLILLGITRVNDWFIDVILLFQDLTSCFKCMPVLDTKSNQRIPFEYTDSDYAGASLDRKSTTGGKAKKSVKLMMEKLFRMELELMLSTVKAKTIHGEEQLHALFDGMKIIITESSVRRDLQLEDDEDKDVHKELGDSLVRAVTTASSLEAEQDNGGGPRCQETIGDTIAQIRLKLDELMALCTTLQNKVLDLEKTKTSQDNEIASFKRRVKKLEKNNRSRTHKLKRLYKGRIDAIDADEEITLVSVHDMNVFAGEEVAKEVVEVINTAKLIINDAQVSAAGDIVSAASAATIVSAATTTTATINTVDDITLAQALEEMKSKKPKKKGIVIQDLVESTTTISSQLSSPQSQDKGKGILIEHVKKKDQISLNEETALNIQAEFDEEVRLAREKAKKEEEANISLIKTWDDIQAKIDTDHQLAERMQAQEQEELSIEEKATLFQQLLEKRRKHFCS